jgi:hypothetical protein
MATVKVDIKPPAKTTENDIDSDNLDSIVDDDSDEV